MKKIILVALIVGCFTSANAQRHKIKDDALDKIVLAVNISGSAMADLDMQKELGLTLEQYEQIVGLNQKRYEQIVQAEELYKEDALSRSKAIYAINLETDKAIGTVLDPTQLRLFLELEGRQQLRFVSDNSED